MTTEESKEKGAKKEKVVVVERKKASKEVVPYHVIDTVDAHTEWTRVVAVFALGPKWQFKDWPAGWTFPADHFSHGKSSSSSSCFVSHKERNNMEIFPLTVKGFHLMYEGTPIDPAIKSWNVTRLQVRLNELTILNFF